MMSLEISFIVSFTKINTFQENKRSLGLLCNREQVTTLNVCLFICKQGRKRI